MTKLLKCAHCGGIVKEVCSGCWKCPSCCDCPEKTGRTINGHIGKSKKEEMKKGGKK